MKIHSFVNTLATSLALSLLGALPASAQSIAGQGTWETTLLGRDVNLQAVSATSASAVYLYDTSLNVTWLRDANANVVGKDYTDANATAEGWMSWTDATNWATNLVTGSGGTAISDWRLPTMAANNPNPSWSNDGSTAYGSNVPASSSEMANLFFATLGNKSYYDTGGNGPQSEYGLTNTGSFQNMQSDYYWFGTEYASDTNLVWGFATSLGLQLYGDKIGPLSAMAVRSGDVLSPVPEPDTYPMLLLGLGLLGVLVRRRTRAHGTWAG